MPTPRHISAFFLTCFLSMILVSCLKETPLPVVVDFEYKLAGEYNTTPVTITLENKTTGADLFEWTFEGGTPSGSSDKNPGEVTFTKPGEHKITLSARNHDLDGYKQIVVRVDSAVAVDFDYQILVNDFAPALVNFANRTTGASTFEWTFEGGDPATSVLADPGIVRFAETGEHKVSLVVSNGSEIFRTGYTVMLKPELLPAFTTELAVGSADLEAPMTVIVTNTSRSSLSVTWQCPGGEIADPTADRTTIRFTQPGTYNIVMTADNLKEQKSTERQIAVNPNSGIYTLRDLHFGISQARNTVGSLFSADLQRVLKSAEVTSANGQAIDIGFFALNSTFDHCYFFSPDKAAESAFAEIPGATATQINNFNINNITRPAFELITQASDLNSYNFTPGTGHGSGNESDSFTLDQLPVFVVFRTHDGRRGVVMIKETVGNGSESYMVADIKIEK